MLWGWEGDHVMRGHLFTLVCAALLVASGRAGAAALYSPGDVLIVENSTSSSSSRVVAINPDSSAATTVASGLGLGLTGIALDADGSILVAQSGPNQILRIDPNSGASSLVATLPLVSGAVFHIDRLGDSLFVAATDSAGSPNAWVYEVSLSSDAVSVLTSGGFLQDPRGIAVETPTTLLVTDSSLDSVVRVALASGFQSTVTSGPATDGASDVVVGSGLPFVAAFNVGIVALDPTLGPTLISSGVGFRPKGIDVLADGTIVVTNDDPTGAPGDEVILVDPADGSRQTIYVGDSLFGVTVAPLPEPTTALLLACGRVGLGVRLLH
jgi:streptogramin lyase